MDNDDLLMQCIGGPEDDVPCGWRGRESETEQIDGVYGPFPSFEFVHHAGGPDVFYQCPSCGGECAFESYA